jgi:hypothetical protein
MGPVWLHEYPPHRSVLFYVFGYQMCESDIFGGKLSHNLPHGEACDCGLTNLPLDLASVHLPAGTVSYHPAKRNLVASNRPSPSLGATFRLR